MNKFSDMASVKAQKKMIPTNTIVVPHRSLTAYLGYEAIEKKFTVPMFGNRMLFRAEERDEKRNQYYLLKKAGIRYPRIFCMEPRVPSDHCLKRCVAIRGKGATREQMRGQMRRCNILSCRPAKDILKSQIPRCIGADTRAEICALGACNSAYMHLSIPSSILQVMRLRVVLGIGDKRQ